MDRGEKAGSGSYGAERRLHELHRRVAEIQHAEAVGSVRLVLLEPRGELALLQSHRIAVASTRRANATPTVLYCTVLF